MFENHFMVVLAGAVAHYVTGWVLNCNPLIMKQKDKKDCQGYSKDMRVNMALQFVLSLAISLAVCVAITIFAKSQVPVVGKSALEKLSNMFFSQDHTTLNMMNSFHTVLFIWAGFLLPISAEEVIWCGKQVKHWFMEMVFELVSLMAVAATVTFLV